MNKLSEMFFRDRWTSIIALLSLTALVGFGLYTNQLNAPQVVQFILTTLLGLKAADSGGSNVNTK